MHLHVHGLRRENGEAAKWERDLAELRGSLQQATKRATS